MDKEERERFFSSLPFDDIGYYFTLKILKNITNGETVKINNVSTPISKWEIPPEIESNPSLYSSFGKIYVALSFDAVEYGVDLCYISYLRIDGMPVKEKIWNLYKVRKYCLSKHR